MSLEFRFISPTSKRNQPPVPRLFSRTPRLVGGHPQSRGFRVCEFDGDVLLADEFLGRRGFDGDGGFSDARATVGARVATCLGGGRGRGSGVSGGVVCVGVGGTESIGGLGECIGGCFWVY
jgi:hypothetical protein